MLVPEDMWCRSCQLVNTAKENGIKLTFVSKISCLELILERERINFNPSNPKEKTFYMYKLTYDILKR